MPITTDELKTLSARACMDREFRADLLGDPVAAAQRLNITLSDKDAQLLLNGADEIRAAGMRADERHFSATAAFVPLPLLKPSPSSVEGMRPRRGRPARGPREFRKPS